MVEEEKEEIPSRETVKQKMWEAEDAIRTLDAKAREIEKAVPVFIKERNFWRDIAMQYYPDLAITAVPQQKRFAKIKAIPRIMKEVRAVIKSYRPNSKEWIATETANLYDREIKEVVDTMKEMFAMGVIEEREGKVYFSG